MISKTNYLQCLTLLSKHQIKGTGLLPTSPCLSLRLTQDNIQENLALGKEEDAYTLNNKLFFILFLLNGEPTLKLKVANKNQLSLKRKSKSQLKSSFLLFSVFTKPRLITEFFLEKRDVMSPAYVTENTYSLTYTDKVSSFYTLNYYFKYLLPATTLLIPLQCLFSIKSHCKIKFKTMSLYDFWAYLTLTN